MKSACGRDAHRSRLNIPCWLAAAFAATVLVAACSSSDQPPRVAGSGTAGIAPTAAAAANKDVRSLVEQFGQKMQEISTLAPPDAVRGELPQVYGKLLSPRLMADWRAHPDRVVGRNYGSSPWPTRIDIGKVACDAADSCRVTGEVEYVTSNEVVHGGVFLRRGITLDLARTTQGWRIEAVRLAPDRP